MLEADYDSALERFRRVSRLKKELDRRPPIRKSLLTPIAGQMAQSSSGAATAARTARVAPANAPLPAVTFQPPVITAQQISVEEGKMRRVEESIRVFVRVADPKYRQVVPMRFFNLTLTAVEADAYNADFLEEKSARADVARSLIRLVSCLARISTELEELKRSQNMSSLWKLHADALVALLEIASTITEDGENIADTAESNTDAASAQAIRETVQKLGDRSDLAVKALAAPGS
jgi:hypothetical protein